MSLRLKISLLSALISGAILLAFGVASWGLIYRERLAAMDREIRTLAARHPGWLANRANTERLTSMLEFTFGEERKQDVILLVRELSGAVPYQSPHWPANLDPEDLDLSLRDDPTVPEQPSQTAEPLPELHGAGPPWRLRGGGGPGRGGAGYGRGQGSAAFTKVPKFLTVHAGEATWRIGVLGNAQTTLVLGLNFSQIQGELNHLRNAFALVLPLALMLATCGGWIIGGRALRPLRAIAETAENVSARGLDNRIPLAGSEGEVNRVIRVLNTMMDRLEKSFHQATRFTADASHELKTPLAIMQGELENALQHAPAGSPEQSVFNNLLEETQRLKNVTRNLLLLAQADSGQLKLAREQINLSDLLDDAVEDARILASHLRLSFELQIEANLQIRGDPMLLSTAILNLLGNAVKFNEPNGRVTVQARGEGAYVTIVCGNTGPGILIEEQARIFDRFFRSSHAMGRRTEGSGLGLSLAREIIRAHGGDILLGESHPGWTSFTLRIAR